MDPTPAETALAKIIPIPIEFGDVRIGGRTIHYARAGSGPDVILLHGINMGWGQWYPNIAPLAERFTVHALDLPGAGASTTISPYDREFPEILPAAVEEYMAQKKIAHAHLVGHSVGAWVALRVALRGKADIGKMVLASPLGFSVRTPAKYRPLGMKFFAAFLSKTAMSMTPAHMRDFATSVLNHPESLRKEFTDYYYESLRAHGHAHPFLWINRFAGVRCIRKEFMLLNEIPRIANSALIAVGAHDTIIPPDSAHLAAFRTLPHSSVMVFSESGHVAPTEEAGKFNKAVIQFIV